MCDLVLRGGQGGRKGCKGRDRVVIRETAVDGVSVNLYSRGTLIESQPPFIG